MVLLVYPKLKVRSRDQVVRYGGLSNPPLPGLKGLNSLVHGDFSSPAKKEAKPPNAKKSEADSTAPKNLGSISPPPPPHASNDKNQRGEEDSKPHIRASPIPRPRAVLSSPVNDDMIGSKAKQTHERSRSLKPPQLVHKASGSPKSGLDVPKEATNKTEIHKPHRNVTLKHSAAERARGGADTLNDSNTKGSKGLVAMTLRIKK